MKIPKRFALSTLLLVMLLASLIFGYAQWRRQWLKAEVRNLTRDADPILKNIPGFRPVELYDNWFWPKVSRQAGAVVRVDDRGVFSSDGETLTTSGAREYLSNKAKRLRRIGVKEIAYAKLVSGTTRLGTKITIVILDSPDDLEVE